MRPVRTPALLASMVLVAPQARLADDARCADSPLSRPGQSASGKRSSGRPSSPTRCARRCASCPPGRTTSARRETVSTRSGFSGSFTEWGLEARIETFQVLFPTPYSADGDVTPGHRRQAGREAVIRREGAAGESLMIRRRAARAVRAHRPRPPGCRGTGRRGRGCLTAPTSPVAPAYPHARRARAPGWRHRGRGRPRATDSGRRANPPPRPTLARRRA
jgi:hypothetical protein